MSMYRKANWNKLMNDVFNELNNKLLKTRTKVQILDLIDGDFNSL